MPASCTPFPPPVLNVSHHQHKYREGRVWHGFHSTAEYKLSHDQLAASYTQNSESWESSMIQHAYDNPLHHSELITANLLLTVHMHVLYVTTEISL